MLEYSKVILSKLSFDEKLFEKEYRKAIRFLDDDDERTALEAWVRDRRGAMLNYSCKQLHE